MLGREGLKARQRGLIDCQLWLGRNAGWLCMLALLVAALAGAGFFLTSGTSTSAQLEELRAAEARRDDLLRAVRSNRPAAAQGPGSSRTPLEGAGHSSCVAWRGDMACDAERGAFALEEDRACDEQIPYDVGGHCECKSGESVAREAFACELGADGGVVVRDGFTCNEVCSSPKVQRKLRGDKLSHAEEARYDQAAAAERKRKWDEEDARRKAREEEELRQQNLEASADELLLDVHGMIEEKRWTEGRDLIKKALGMYTEAGVVDIPPYADLRFPAVPPPSAAAFSCSRVRLVVS